MSGSNKPYDIYRDSYLRYLGYSNEIGEAFRSLWPRHFVNLSYGVAVSYVLADTADKALRKHRSPGSTVTNVATTAGDVLIWQMFASVIIPGYTINRLAYGTRILVRHFNIRKGKYIPTIVGLSSIPLIIRPIDLLVDHLMDISYRKCFK